MAFTQEHITALENAIASGLKRFKYTDGQSGTETEYQSTSEMLTTLTRMRNEQIAASTAYSAPPTVIRPYRSANNGL